MPPAIPNSEPAPRRMTTRRARTAARADRTALSALRENGRSGASGARIPPRPAGCENDPETREGKAKPKGRAGSCGRAGTVEYPARGRLRSTRLVFCQATFGKPGVDRLESAGAVAAEVGLRQLGSVPPRGDFLKPRLDRRASLSPD